MQILLNVFVYPLEHGIIMKLEKIILDKIPRCYCASYAKVAGELTLLLASEAIGGACYAYSGENFSHKETVWDNSGGTMSIVEIPGKPGEILAVQNFFPGFKAENAKIVWCRRDIKAGWLVRDYITLPYVHRFDLLESDGKAWIVACTLCGSKKDRNDWSDPGKVFVGRLTENPDTPVNLTVLAEGLTHNHGYFRTSINGRSAGLVASDSGVMVVIPPVTSGDRWTMRTLLNTPAGDVAFFDINGDGVDELITIEPFHGNKVRIYELIKQEYQPVYDLPYPVDFAHALWAGKLCGEPCALIGVRKMGCELFRISHTSGEYRTEILESGCGPSNVAVAYGEDCDYIISANHTKSEAAVYVAREEKP